MNTIILILMFATKKRNTKFLQYILKSNLICSDRVIIVVLSLQELHYFRLPYEFS